MYYGYRFVEKAGRSHAADPLETPEEIYAYIKMHRYDFPEIRITERASDALAIHVLDVRIEFPKQWALMEIRETFILDADIFNAPGFAKALEGAGFQLSDPLPQTHVEAERLMRSLYESLEGQQSKQF